MGRESRAKRNSVEEKHSPWYGYYFVAFIDLLGQQDELMKLTSLPHSLDHKAEVEEVLKRTAKNVKWIRDTFRSTFEEIAKSRVPLDQVPDGVRNEYLKFRALTFHQIGFSDSFVLAVSLRQDEFGPAKPAIAVAAALRATAVIALTAMGAAGIPLRGGIDVERGLDLFPNEIYGPALINAYRLESSVAEYPRLLIGDGLLRYIATLEQLPAESWINEVAIENASMCRRIICEAPDDGHPMLDIFSSGVLELNPLLNELRPKMRAWVTQELERHRKLGNGKLERRYRRLLLYLDGNDTS